MEDVLWISWEWHRRTVGISDYLGVKLEVLTSDRWLFIRHMLLGLRTLVLICSRRPKVLMVQNPSIVLTLLAVVLRPVCRYRLIVDAHNEAINPFVQNNRLVKAVARFLLKKADITIVTNQALVEKVEACGGRAVVLPDRLPAPGVVVPLELPAGRFNFLLVATFTDDEPVLQVFEAIRTLESKTRLLVTGNYTRLDASLRQTLPDNIVFTGYLSDDDYWSHLAQVDAVIDLTTMDDCMVCGAYEAVSVARPLVLTRNDACVNYFTKGVVYTDNSVKDIGRALSEMIDNHAEYVKQIRELRDELPGRWQKNADALQLAISDYL